MMNSFSSGMHKKSPKCDVLLIKTGKYHSGLIFKTVFSDIPIIPYVCWLPWLPARVEVAGTPGGRPLSCCRRTKARMKQMRPQRSKN